MRPLGRKPRDFLDPPFTRITGFCDGLMSRLHGENHHFVLVIRIREQRTFITIIVQVRGPRKSRDVVVVLKRRSSINPPSGERHAQLRAHGPGHDPGTQSARIATPHLKRSVAGRALAVYRDIAAARQNGQHGPPHAAQPARRPRQRYHMVQRPAHPRDRRRAPRRVADSLGEVLSRGCEERFVEFRVSPLHCWESQRYVVELPEVLVLLILRFGTAAAFG